MVGIGKSRAFLLTAVVVAGLATRSATGSQGTAPPITLDTLKGRWEGINFEQPRVLLMRVCQPNNSVVVMSVGGRAYPYRSRALTVSKGTFVLEAVDESGERLTVSGSGSAVTEGGRMEGKITWYEPDGAPVVVPMSFFKEKGGYVNHLRSLVQDAEDASPGRGAP